MLELWNLAARLWPVQDGEGRFVVMCWLPECQAHQLPDAATRPRCRPCFRKAASAITAPILTSRSWGGGHSDGRSLHSPNHLPYAFAMEGLQADAPGPRPHDLVVGAQIRQTMGRLKQEKAARHGYIRVGSKRYAYIYSQGAGLRLNRKARNALAELHGNLGHPSYRRLARTLVNVGASKELIQGAKVLHGIVYEHLQDPATKPPASHRAPGDFNEQLLFDTFFVPDALAKRWLVTQALCRLSIYHVGRAYQNPSSKKSVNSSALRMWRKSIPALNSVATSLASATLDECQGRCVPLSNKFKHRLSGDSAPWRS